MASNSNKEIVEDFLEADSPIRGQNYVCLSFISPEKVLKNKEIFKVTNFLEFLFKDSHTCDENGNVNAPSPAQLAREKLIKNPSSITYDYVSELYEDWKYSRDEDLEAKFAEKNDFHTTTRGLKIRGVYETEREAKVRAQVLQRKDPSFHVFVGQVGYWLPWDPSADGIADQEYTEGALNDLVKKYKENIQQRDDHYEEVKREKLEKIRKENEEKRRKLMEAGVTGQHLHNAEDSKKNVETLREVVDSADRQNVEVPAFTPTSETSSGSFLEKDQSQGASVEQESVISESDPQNGFKSEQMSGLESMDPWMRRKMEEEASKDNNV
jgi:hypothetical protein